MFVLWKLLKGDIAWWTCSRTPWQMLKLAAALLCDSWWCTPKENLKKTHQAVFYMLLFAMSYIYMKFKDLPFFPFFRSLINISIYYIYIYMYYIYIIYETTYLYITYLYIWYVCTYISSLMQGPERGPSSDTRTGHRCSVFFLVFGTGQTWQGCQSLWSFVGDLVISLEAMDFGLKTRVPGFVECFLKPKDNYIKICCVFLMVLHTSMYKYIYIYTYLDRHIRVKLLEDTHW